MQKWIKDLIDILQNRHKMYNKLMGNINISHQYGIVTCKIKCHIIVIEVSKQKQRKK